MKAGAPSKDRTVVTPELDPATRRRILQFLNGAVVPEDLVHQRVATLHEGDHIHEDNPELQSRPRRPSSTLTAPHGGHPHSLAQQGYYLLFAINDNGVPSYGHWIYLH